MTGSRNKVGIIGDLQPGLNSKIFKVEIISTEEPFAQLNHTTRSDSDSRFFCHCSGSCFCACRQLSAPKQSTVCVNRTPCHIACTDVNTVSTQHIALICYKLTRGLSCAFHKIFIPSVVSRHRFYGSRTSHIHTTATTCDISSSLVLTPCAIGCAVTGLTAVMALPC